MCRPLCAVLRRAIIFLSFLKGIAMRIKELEAYEILDSNGIPTVECHLVLDDGAKFISSVPAGKSVSKYEAIELRDGDLRFFSGKGVGKAVNNIRHEIAPNIIGKEINFFEIDQILLELDGTENKAHLGANATLAVSMAAARANAYFKKQEFFEFINSSMHINVKPELPRVMFNLVSGGVHGNNGIAFQEFMIVNMKDKNFTEVLESVYFIYQNLKTLLHESGHSIGVGSEGAFIPVIKPSNDKIPEQIVLDFIMQAINESGFNTEEFTIALDVAASQFFDHASGTYKLYGKSYGFNDLIDLYDNLAEHYPIFSIEDGLDQDDWLGWNGLYARMGEFTQIVGDDIFATNEKLITKGANKNIANATIIKPNQIGTVSETLHVIKLCKSYGMHTIVSHRSGDTNDDFISDLAVGAHAGQFKSGAPVRGERVAKYNRLLHIGRLLG